MNFTQSSDGLNLIENSMEQFDTEAEISIFPEANKCYLIMFGLLQTAVGF